MTVAPDPELPFELAWRAEGRWRAYWSTQKLIIAVAGTAEAPDATLLATLRDLISRWPKVQENIAAFARALASDEHIPLDPRTLGGFAAGSCGFDQKLVFSSITLTDPSAPHVVAVTFYTGLPDGYATYEVVLNHGTPTSIGAFAS